MSRILGVLLGMLVFCGAATALAADDPGAFFEARIRPVLIRDCFKCHGGQKTSHGLRVDSREALIKGGERGPAVVPGNPEKSLVVAAIRHADDDLAMPPGRKLDRAVGDDFAAWIKAGAPWPQATSKAAFKAEKHWAFEPVKDPRPPDDPSGWSASPIDRFLAARYREHGLKPVGSADPRTLIRRVTFDLTGLPPTPEETETFAADPSPAAYEKLVEKLLASPRYGERWGRHWLDVARYADTAGDNADYPVPEAKLYRDYVIAAFNADKPYDAFVREQLAGDILAAEGPRDRYAERVAATGFLALSRRFATAPYELWHLSVEDAIETTGKAFLGLSLRCARCHDHKFDPVTSADYYSLYGIFASTNFPYAGSEEFASMAKPRQHFVPLVPPDEAAPKLDAYRAALKKTEADLRKAGKEDPGLKRLDELTAQIADLEARSLKLDPKSAEPLNRQVILLRQQEDDLRRQLRAKPAWAPVRTLMNPGLPADLPGAYAVSEGTPVEVPIQRGGDPGNPGPVVPRGVPKFLAGNNAPSFPSGSSGRRELADWLTRPDHPLTARVMVNRVWQYHFGRGIVATPSNFGLRGAEPTHPELLDWLAARFVATGWSVKSMHRLILLSNAYRLSSANDPENAARDPGNQWHWRAERRRLDAESIRDALLVAGGHLDTRTPLDHPFPPIAQWGWTQHNAFKAVYPSDQRSVYLMTQRLQRHPYLALFDGPDTNASTDLRPTSTVPLQALYLMNNPFVHEQAAGLAERVRPVFRDNAGRVDALVSSAWNRPATREETGKALEYVDRMKGELVRGGLPEAEADRAAWASYAKVLLSANEFFYVD